MSKSAIDALIQREIDGRNSEQESASLMKLIENSDEIREKYMEMVGLVENLREVEEVSPPRHLREKISQALNSSQRPERSSKRNLWGRFSDFMAASVFVRPSYAFVAGISATLLLVVATVSIIGLSGGAATEDQIVGTLLRGIDLSDATTVDEGTLSLNSSMVNVEVQREGEKAVATLVAVTAPIAVAISLDDSQSSISAIVSEIPESVHVSWQGGVASITFDRAGKVHLICDAGSGEPHAKIRIALKSGRQEKAQEFRLDD